MYSSYSVLSESEEVQLIFNSALFFLSLATFSEVKVLAFISNVSESQFDDSSSYSSCWS